MIPHFYSDLHGAHKNIIKFRSQLGFTTEQEHWDYCKDRYHSTVGKRDIVYCLGDMCFSLERAIEFSQWPGRKILIAGNHDTQYIPMAELCKLYDAVYGFTRYKEFWLSHCPIAEQELRGKVNLHGHVHPYSIPDPRYFNCCLENIDYKPISLDQVRQRILDNKAGKQE